MKAKSMKLRLLITLYALFKYSDENHRMNTIKLNPFLEPFGLDCTSPVLSDTVRIMKEFGIDVRHKGEWDSQGVWINDRPLQDDTLKALIFAVTTNPNIDQEEANRILGNLKPLVTVYQEPLLESLVETNKNMEPGELTMYDKYAVVCDAIKTGRRIRYRISYLKYDRETQSVYFENEWPTLFTPKGFYLQNGEIYVIGYNNTDKKEAAIQLARISEVKLAFKHKDPLREQVQEILNNIEPEDVVKKVDSTIIYQGPVEFLCKGQYLEALYSRFGEPSGPIDKDRRSRCIYSINEAQITAETLFWLASIEDYGIRINGPEKLKSAVKDYYANTSLILLDNDKLTLSHPERYYSFL